MKIYCARPFTGFTKTQILEYYDYLKGALGGSYDLLIPMVAVNAVGPDTKIWRHGKNDIPEISEKAIVARDLWLIEHADIILVDVSECAGVAIGCVMELAWAKLLGRHTITVMDVGNPHHHAFITETSDVVFPVLESALEYLLELKKGGV